MVTKCMHDSNRKTAAIICIVCYHYKYITDVCISGKITTQRIVFCHLMAQLPQVLCVQGRSVDDLAIAFTIVKLPTTGLNNSSLGLQALPLLSL
jgi:hypothetical protein